MERCLVDNVCTSTKLQDGETSVTVQQFPVIEYSHFIHKIKNLQNVNIEIYKRTLQYKLLRYVSRSNSILYFQVKHYLRPKA